METIGLLIIHGIGNQKEGDLSRKMAEQLSGEKAEFADQEPIIPIQMDDINVNITEAYWASMSHPDNPPQIRLSYQIISDYFDTLSSVWHKSMIYNMYRYFAENKSARRKLYYFMITILLSLIIGEVIKYTSLQSTENVKYTFFLSNIDPVTIVFGILSVLFVISIFYFTWKICFAFYCMLLRSNNNRILIFIYMILFLIPGLVMGLIRTLFTPFVIFIFIIWTVIVIIGLILAHILYPFVVLFNGIQYLLKIIKLKYICRWLNRLNWILFVFPTHTLLQASKATGVLISIMVNEKKINIKMAAILEWIMIFLISLNITVFFSIMLSTIISIIIQGVTGGERIPHEVKIIFPVMYLIFIAITLPILDITLDISNYHLANQKERRTYFHTIEKSLNSLLKAGCKEIHILAHSLGTVITYDFLRSISLNDFTYPITRLYTAGSPLDIFWYIDHSRSKRMDDEDGLSKYISGTWINFWAFADPVTGILLPWGGPIKHYGAPGDGIYNERIRMKCLWLISHTLYWTNPIIIETIRKKLLSE